MPDAYDAIQGGLQTAFNTLTELTRDEDTVILLQQDPTSRAYTAVLEVSDSWFWKGATTKQNALLRIARDDQELTDAMATATHIQLGDDIFVITKTDVIPPSGFDVMWQIYVEAFTTKAQFNSLS